MGSSETFLRFLDKLTLAVIIQNMTKIKRIEDYLYSFINNNIWEFDSFYRSTSEQRNYGIYKLENGSSILDFLGDLHYNIYEYLNFTRLIPDRFTTPEDLLQYLDSLKNYILKKNYLFSEDNINVDTNYIISHSVMYKNKILKAIDYCFQIYDLEDENILLYQQLRFHLIKEDVTSFINDLKSIFSSVSYAIAKETEGYYHANVYLILKLLGFDIISEETTNIGRIDSVIKFSNKIYILEFKFSEGDNDSEIAFNQIIEKDYASKYKIENKSIFGLGISFNQNIRNIRNYKFGEL